MLIDQIACTNAMKKELNEEINTQVEEISYCRKQITVAHNGLRCAHVWIERDESTLQCPICKNLLALEAHDNLVKE